MVTNGTPNDLLLSAKAINIILFNLLKSAFSVKNKQKNFT